MKWSSIGLVGAYCIASCVLYWYLYTNSPFYLNNKHDFNLAFVVCRTVKFACDIFVSIIFILVIKFLLKYRSGTKRKFTVFNKAILTMVFLVFLANLAKVKTAFIVIFYQINDPDYSQSELNKVMLFLNLAIFPIKDFLSGLGFSYLYYA